IAASSQTIEQRWRRYIDQPHRRGPGRRQSQTVIAKTVGKDQSQQVYRGFYHASLQKSPGLPRAALKSRRPPKPSYDMFPVPIQQRFVSHSTLNHKPRQTSKNILTPMRESGASSIPLVMRGMMRCPKTKACDYGTPLLRVREIISASSLRGAMT